MICSLRACAGASVSRLLLSSRLTSQRQRKQPVRAFAAAVAPTGGVKHDKELQYVASRLAEGFAQDKLSVLLCGPDRASQFFYHFCRSTVADLDASNSLFQIENASCVALCYEYPYQEDHGRHLHLLLLSVIPSAQRQGLGSRMLDSLMARADAQQLPMYLEASSESSRQLYARKGFQDVSSFTALPRIAGSPTFYCMWRPPRMPQ